MSLNRLVIGDANVSRFWAAAQLARPQLLGVTLRSASCLDTLAAALSDVTDNLDYVLVYMLSEFLIDEGSAADVVGSCSNIVSDVLKSLTSSARKSSNVQV